MKWHNSFFVQLPIGINNFGNILTSFPQHFCVCIPKKFEFSSGRILELDSNNGKSGLFHNVDRLCSFESSNVKFFFLNPYTQTVRGISGFNQLLSTNPKQSVEAEHRYQIAWWTALNLIRFKWTSFLNSIESLRFVADWEREGALAHWLLHVQGMCASVWVCLIRTSPK